MPKTLEEWGEYHATLFGFQPSAAPMVRAWLDEFAASGYRPDELTAATKAIGLLESPPRYPGDHYAVLHRQVQAERARQREEFASRETRRVASGDDRGACEICGNAKWVIVPHTSHLAEWVDAARFVTFGVVCRCFLGRAMAANWDAKRPRPLTLEEYERKVPNWRELLESERQIRASRCRTANVMAGPLADTLRGVMARMKEGQA
jgi:hypothetical protein